MRFLNNFGIILFFSSLVIYLFMPVSPAFALGKKSGICGSWNNYCKKPTTTGTFTPVPAGPTAKERKEQWNKQDSQEASLDAYDTGVEFFDKQEWGNAIMHFKEALEYDPENYDALDDLNTAKQKLHEASVRQMAKNKALREASMRKMQKNKALQEAKAAAKHGKSLNYKESQKVFDTRGSRTTSSTSTVDATGYKEILGRKVDVPKEHKNNPKILKMQKERKVLETKFKKLEKSLKDIKKKRAEGKEDKGKLQVQEVKIKMEMDNVKQNTQVIDVKMESFVITLTKKKSSPKK